MTLGDFLRMVDLGPLDIIVYGADDAEPIWYGSPLDCPYWVADYEIDKSYNENAPIDYWSSFGEYGKDSKGLRIVVIEE
jgi:hypothetical protein